MSHASVAIGNGAGGGLGATTSTAVISVIVRPPIARSRTRRSTSFRPIMPAAPTTRIFMPPSPSYPRRRCSSRHRRGATPPRSAAASKKFDRGTQELDAALPGRGKLENVKEPVKQRDRTRRFLDVFRRDTPALGNQGKEGFTKVGS